jgi:hypothetical protein
MNRNSAQNRQELIKRLLKVEAVAVRAPLLFSQNRYSESESKNVNSENSMKCDDSCDGLSKFESGNTK